MLNPNEYTFFEGSPEWKGRAAVCIAGGVSLTQEQVDSVRGLKAIGVNDAYRIAPWIDILYACDAKWWEWHNGVPDFKGLRLQHYYANKVGKKTPEIRRQDIHLVMSTGKEGFDSDPKYIRNGGNSGYQALHVAMHMMPDVILLLGYDMHDRTKKGHWFGSHPKPYDNVTRPFNDWIKEFTSLAVAAKDRGQQIINCTPDSAIECFDRMHLNDALKLCKERKLCS